MLLGLCRRVFGDEVACIYVYLIGSIIILGRERTTDEEKHCEVRCAGLRNHFEAREHKGEKAIPHIAAHRRRW